MSRIRIKIPLPFEKAIWYKPVVNLQRQLLSMRCFLCRLFALIDLISPPPALQETRAQYTAYFWHPLPKEVDLFITSTPEMVRSWKPDCPAPKNSLAYAQINHWDFNKTIQIGEMVINLDVVKDVGEIFEELFTSQYSIEKMRLIDCYDADDDRSMEDNNSSAFCSRAVTDRPGKFSIHSYGRAIDINPRRNPYIRARDDGSRAIYPKNTPEEFIAQSEIQKGDVCQSAFENHGWNWGGTWKNPKDFQHFQKIIEE